MGKADRPKLFESRITLSTGKRSSALTPNQWKRGESLGLSFASSRDSNARLLNVIHSNFIRRFFLIFGTFCIENGAEFSFQQRRVNITLSSREN